VWEFNFAADGQEHFAWPAPIYVAEGVFVEVTTALTSGSIDII
jgi:hypothetical protein